MNLLEMPRRIEWIMPLALSVALLGACKKKDDAPAGASSAAATAPAASAAKASASGATVAFAGTYKKFAEDTMRNGRHIHEVSSDGNVSIVIDGGSATWLQSYTSKGQALHANEVYTFGPADVKPIPNGFHVTLTFQSMDSDDKGYTPDNRNPQLEAHKTATGWDIALSTTDKNGVVSGVEFK